MNSRMINQPYPQRSGGHAVQVLRALVLVTFTGALAATVFAASPTTAPAKMIDKPATTQPAPPTPEDLVLGFAMQNEPDIYKWLLVLREKDPKRYNDLIREFTPEVRKLSDLKKRNPDMFQLTIEDRRLYFQSLQLSRDNPAATGPAEQARHQKLETVVKMQFEVRQKLRQVELDEAAARIQALQKQLDRLKSELETRERNKDTLIEQRIEDLTNKNAKMEW